MKTTIDIHDDLLVRAKNHTKATGRTLGAVVEDGLRTVLSQAEPNVGYVLEDCSVGRPGDPNPLERYSWDQLRDLIYVDPISAR